MFEHLPAAILEESLATVDGTTSARVADEMCGEIRLAICGEISGFSGETENGAVLLVPQCSRPAPASALAVSCAAWITNLGGFGNRLELATPGHVQAVRATGIASLFAQQSVRENARTRRTSQQVLDD